MPTNRTSSKRGASIRRRVVTLSVALSFTVLAVSGVVAFVRPFSLQIVGLHALMGFVFILLIGFHVANNLRPLKAYLRSPMLGLCLATIATLTVLFLLQPAAVKSILRLSGNLGPALDRFEMGRDQLEYRYTPAPHYKMALTVEMGDAYDAEHPPQVAIWLENQGAYHIKTLHSTSEEPTEMLPYWSFKRRGWEQAKREAEELDEVDGTSAATPNGSFDPADYVLPAEADKPMPYKLLIEINQPGDAHGTYDDQPSLVYAVEIDNSLPRTFQVLDLMGYPQQEETDGKEAWALYYVDESFGSALELIDSALLTIERTQPEANRE